MTMSLTMLHLMLRHTRDEFHAIHHQSAFFIELRPFMMLSLVNIGISRVSFFQSRTFCRYPQKYLKATSYPFLKNIFSTSHPWYWTVYSKSWIKRLKVIQGFFFRTFRKFYSYRTWDKILDTPSLVIYFTITFILKIFSYYLKKSLNTIL